MFKYAYIVGLGLILLMSLTGCPPRAKVFSSDSFFAPRPAGMGKPDPNAPPEHTKGWNDGCQTGMSTMVQDYYKNFYTYTLDVNMINNPTYYKAWKDAYTYCRQYAFRYTWDAFDRRRGAGLLQVQPLCVLCPNEVR